MTEAEFEELDCEFQRLCRSKRNPTRAAILAALLTRCRHCGREDPEFYMLRRELWLKAVPSGRGCLCLACLELRLDRRLSREDFGMAPITRDGEEIDLG